MGISSLVLVVVLMPSAIPDRTPAELERAGFDALKKFEYAQALEWFDALASAAPRLAAAHLGRGMALSGLLNYAAAVAAFERAVSLDPRSALAWQELVILDSQIGKKAEARAAYEHVRALGEIAVDQKLPLARALRTAGWTAEARDLLLELPVDARSDGENLELGVIALNQADHAGAAELLERATRNPKTSDAEAEYELGRALEALGRTQEALAHYRLAHQKDPQHRSARFRLGSLLLRTADVEEGRALLDGYEEHRQWDRRVKLLLLIVTSGKLGETEQRDRSLQLVNLLLQGGDLDQAEPVIRQALAAHPNDPDLLVAEARWLLARGEPKRAHETLAPVLSRPTPPPDALWLSARLDLLEGRVSEALHTYEGLLAKDPDPPARLLGEIGAAYAVGGKPAKAEETFLRALEKDPSRPETHVGLALLLQTLSRRPEAEQHLRRALALEPDLPSAEKALGGLLLEKGDAGAAETLLERSVKAHPKDTELRLALARTLDALGRAEEAEAQRRAARELESRRKP